MLCKCNRYVPFLATRDSACIPTCFVPPFCIPAASKQQASHYLNQAAPRSINHPKTTTPKNKIKKMAPREILDSEDDGDGFDDDQEEYGETLVPPDATVEQQAAAPPATSAAINNVAATNISTTTLSTDSSFFERVYEGQYIAFDLEQPVAATTATATEMPPSTRKATGRAKAKTNDAVVDLTTPRKTDVWDFPGSSLPPTAEPGSRRSARKRAQVGVGVGEEEEDPYAFPESTPAAKRTRRSLGAAASPVALVGGVGMYVATSEMTASQKEQHVAVSLPNSSTSEVMGGTFPTLPQGEGQSSSGGTLSTIAYTTPSRIGSSDRRDISSMGGVGSGGGEIDTPARYQVCVRTVVGVEMWGLTSVTVITGCVERHGASFDRQQEKGQG